MDQTLYLTSVHFETLSIALDWLATAAPRDKQMQICNLSGEEHQMWPSPRSSSNSPRPFLVNAEIPTEIAGIKYGRELWRGTEARRRSAGWHYHNTVTWALLGRHDPAAAPPLWLSRGLLISVIVLPVAHEPGRCARQLDTQVEHRDVINTFERNQGVFALMIYVGRDKCVILIPRGQSSLCQWRTETAGKLIITLNFASIFLK